MSNLMRRRRRRRLSQICCTSQMSNFMRYRRRRRRSMDNRRRKLSSCGTQIDDLPSCLIMDILLRLPTPSLLSCRVVCKSWYLIFSDPLFVKLHLARSPTYLIRENFGKPMKFYSRYCRSLVPGMSSQASAPQGASTFQYDDSIFTCINSSSNGLLCLENCKSRDEVYVCNPILGQYITIKTGIAEVVTSFCLGFSSRSNQFKVLQIMSPTPEHIAPYMARIYTIGDGTRQWKSVGIAPSCPLFMFGGFLNGSIHWADDQTHEIFYFNFDTEQFGTLPSPPGRRDGRWFARMGLLHGCLFYYVTGEDGFWIMKEYGVEESWTKMSSIFRPPHEPSLLYENFIIQLEEVATTYNPSFISLQDVAKGEQLNLIS